MCGVHDGSEVGGRSERNVGAGSGEVGDLGTAGIGVSDDEGARPRAGGGGSEGDIDDASLALGQGGGASVGLGEISGGRDVGDGEFGGGLIDESEGSGRIAG